MARRENTKGKIARTAWKLFHEKGYENTTIDEIISESGTSKGSFYHYYSGKDELLSSLSSIFDEKYEEILQTLDPEMDSFEKLMFLNRELFAMIENQVSLDLLARLFSSQLITKGERHGLCEVTKGFSFTLTGLRGFKEAIITQGGVSVKEIDPATMEAKKVRGLRFAGEVLDLDAQTGGFNLQIAWSTGWAAGR